jgi:heme exporter protein C
MSTEIKIPEWLSQILHADRWLVYLVMPAIFYMLGLVFLGVPNEQLMGPVQRIFYVHVGSAIASYFCFAIAFICSIGYLVERSRLFDVVNEAAAELGFVLCSIVLASGMIWGHSAWNTWFSWEPRLVTFLLLWLIFLGFIFLRTFGESPNLAKHSAVLGVVGTLMVPVMVYSIKLWPSLAQLHPEVVAKGGLHPDMKVAMAVAIITILLLTCLLLIYRIKLGLLKANVARMEAQYGSR